MQAENVITVTNNLKKAALKNSHSDQYVNFQLDEQLELRRMNEEILPMEYVLDALNDCILLVVEMISKEIGFSFNHLKAETVGIVDRGGMFGIGDVSPHFRRVSNKIWFDTNESMYRIQVLKEHVKKRCPAYNLLYDAGVNIQLNWGYAEREH